MSDEERYIRKEARKLRNQVESQWIEKTRMADRLRLKEKLYTERERERLDLLAARKDQLERWMRRLDRSAYRVDLLAENERIDEENKVRLSEQYGRAKLLDQKKDKVKTQIILRALAEDDDVEALRREKRLLSEEERRLKALIDVEKVANARLQDPYAARLEIRKRNEELVLQQQQRRAEQEADMAVRRHALINKLFN